ncbi:hypothetical protein CSUI_000754 [Cystoisospora suis]|uniref:Transmembrane protein n=1 Tax=Cystoisospora suis TaxID=483139 RepID=A0A2C6LEZ9_9APIC|nr:hypothetical protein CSUI_000754 [Cystoisospora suis]
MKKENTAWTEGGGKRRAVKTALSLGYITVLRCDAVGFFLGQNQRHLPLCTAKEEERARSESRCLTLATACRTKGCVVPFTGKMNAEGRGGGVRQWRTRLSLDYIFICRHTPACCIVFLLVYFCGYILLVLSEAGWSIAHNMHHRK